ncbi:hypothetical protein ACH495_01870 [Micromonospora sp. NPDC018662]|uniref:hypothetical protein n=1 Tax=Micromonospora sp. NPDC018662 TaxID=3364238 RepID=UPI0037AE6492
MSDSGATDERATPRGTAGPEPDVLLDVPELSVDEIRLAVDGLDADLSLRARLANLLQLDAGVRVHLEGVELDITGVRAEALLKVRLEKLVQILDRALTTIDRNPHLIDALARSVGVTVDDVHRAAGQVVEQVTGTGEVLDRTGQQVAEVDEVVDRTGPAVMDRIERDTPSESGARAPYGGGPAAGSSAPAAERPAGTARPAETGSVREPGSEAVGDAASSGAGAGVAPAQAAGSGGDAEPGTGPGSAARASPADGEVGPGGAAQPGAGAAHLAGQAGQTLRQAGRSVWEAIQGGMSQHRPRR